VPDAERIVLLIFEVIAIAHSVRVGGASMI
jgi:hypothetical protein